MSVQIDHKLQDNLHGQIKRIKNDWQIIKQLSNQVQMMGDQSFGQNPHNKLSTEKNVCKEIKAQVKTLCTTLQEAIRVIDIKIVVIMKQIEKIDYKNQMESKVEEQKILMAEMQDKINYLRQGQELGMKKIGDVSASKQAMKEQYELEIANLKAEIKEMQKKNISTLEISQAVHLKNKFKQQNYQSNKNQTERYRSNPPLIQKNSDEYSLREIKIRGVDKIEEDINVNLSPLKQALVKSDYNDKNDRIDNNYKELKLNKKQTDQPYGYIQDYDEIYQQNNKGFGCSPEQDNSINNFTNKKFSNLNKSFNFNSYRGVIASPQNDKTNHSHRLQFLMNNLRDVQQSTKTTLGEQQPSTLSSGVFQRYQI